MNFNKHQKTCYQRADKTKSSIFKIILTHSVARQRALSVTSVGYLIS